MFQYIYICAKINKYICINIIRVDAPCMEYLPIYVDHNGVITYIYIIYVDHKVKQNVGKYIPYVEHIIGMI